MKRVLASFIIVLFSLLSNSQNINFPDEIFKNYLLGIGIDTNGDGEINANEALAYNGPILIDSLNISDLTGIWGLTNITLLSASYNCLTFLNLGFKFHLDTIKVDHNYLDTLIVGQCMNLKYLNCDYNYLSTVNFNYSIDEIEKLECSYNNIVKIEFPTYIDNNLKILNCSHNNISYINLDDLPGLTELNCSYCNIDSLKLDSSLKILDCSNNDLSILSLNDQTQLHYINCASNELEDINLSNCSNIDTVICSHNNLAGLNLIFNFKLNWVDFSNNHNLEVLCVNQLPLPFGISDNETNYKIEVCTQEYQNTFKAGQFLGVLDYNLQDHNFYDSAKFDITGDNIIDIKFSSIRNGNQYWGDINYYVRPVSPTLMAWESFYINGLIYPPSFSWSDSSNSMHIYYAYGEIGGGAYSYWDISGHYLAFKTPADGDTIYSYILLDNGWSDFSLNLSNYASWSPCLSSISLGNDTIITLKDTLTLNAGNDFQNYFWNTGDTTQSINIISQEFGEGVWNIGVYVKLFNCYYTDTVKIQIIDNSGVSEIENKILKVFPNPTKDRLEIVNNGTEYGIISLFDINGRKLMSLKLLTQITFDLSNYKKGIYYLEFVTDKETITNKIIKL